MTQKNRLDFTAMTILVVLCASWGLQQVAIKVANQGIPPILQAGMRSTGATFLLWILNEPISSRLLLTLVLVGTGIYLVNRPVPDREDHR